VRTLWRPPAALIALALGSLIALSRLALTPVLADQSPFIMAAPSLIVAAFLGGMWPTFAVGVVGLWAGEVAMTSSGGTGLRAGGLIIFLLFTGVFAAAGEMRHRGLRRARLDADRLAEMQLRLARVARLNAMGEMAGTLAHELNQPLTAIASYAGAAQWLAKQQKGKGAEIADLLQKVSDQAVRARDIIGRIRNHVSGGELDIRPHALPEMFAEALTVVTATARPEATIRYEFAAGQDRVLADRVQLLQVMVNLLRNALEAVRGAPSRGLWIGSRAGEDGLVEAFVADSGGGIDPEVASRLFEPFVTSKSDGTGIGLAVTRNIVEAHGGRIWAEPRAEGGTVFRFTLPPAEAEVRG
jgi:two-component system sensor kinase FixL